MQVHRSWHTLWDVFSFSKSCFLPCNARYVPVAHRGAKGNSPVANLALVNFDVNWKACCINDDLAL